MATQPRLIPTKFHLDNASREAGKRGLVKARAALAEAHAKLASDHHDDHATAA